MNNDRFVDESYMRRITISAGVVSDLSVYPLNNIQSAKYSRWSLVPQNLFEQMQRTSNIWFLLVSVFQLIPYNLNPTDSWSTIAPLTILITFTLLKDAYDDYYRHEEDKKINNLEYLYWDGDQFKTIPNKELRVGHIVLLYEGESVPADMLLLVIGGNTSKCFVNEANVYGSTDLSIKTSVEETQHFFDDRMDLKKFYAKVFVNQPHPEFFAFRGQFELKGFPKKIEISNDELLLRGSVVQEVPWVIGIILYTGIETKTQLNHHRIPRKTSRIEQEVNLWVLFILLVLLALVVFTILVSYLVSSTESCLSVIELFVAFTILYNNIIPISLFVVVDIVRVMQLFFIQTYTHKRVSFKTGDVNEDLGQIEYILSDKTGTITENGTRLYKCIVNNLSFAREKSHTRSKAPEDSLVDQTIEIDNRSIAYTFDDLKSMISQTDSIYYHFSRCLALCNSMTVKENYERCLGHSIEEKVFIHAAKDLGVSLVAKNWKEARVEVNSKDENYVILGVNPFSSDNKRSHILVRSLALGKSFLYVKGAPEVMEELIGASLERQTGELHRSGKRTMVLAYKEISESEAEALKHKIDLATIAVINKDQRISSVFLGMEKDLALLGVTGIDEEVSAATQDTIEHLLRAGIKVWIVSGDSEGSVHSAALNSRILKPSTPAVDFTMIENTIQCARFLKRALESHVHHENAMNYSRPSSVLRSYTNNDIDENSGIERMVSNNVEAMLANHPIIKEIAIHPDMDSKLMNASFRYKDVAFFISMDGVSFKTALSDVSCKKMLLALLLAADTVCCHRFLPRDKSTLVRLIKENYKFKPLTLAIGDGNNDIPMLQEAHVGIGLNSKTSMQAQNYSEIVVSHFSDLKSLILLHGHWNYSRMSRTILLFFYKNFILTVTMFLYLFNSDYSGASVFEAGFLVGYNIFFTTMPVLVTGTLDRDLPRKDIFKDPSIYADGIFSRSFSWKHLLSYSALSIVHGLILSLTTRYSLDKTITESGKTLSTELLGVSLFMGIIVIVLMQITIDTYKITLIYICSVLGSASTFIFYLMIVSFFDVFQENLLGILNDLFSSPLTLLVCLLTPLMCVLISILVVVFPRVFFNVKHSVTCRLEEFSSGLQQALKLSNLTDKDDINNEAYELKKYSLQFRSKYIERSYRKVLINENIKLYQFMACFFAIFLIVWTIIEAALLDAGLIFNLIRILLCGVFSVVVFLFFTEHYKRNCIFYNILVINIVICIKHALYIWFIRTGALASALIPSITYLLVNIDFLKITLSNILNSSLFLIELLMYIKFTDEEDFTLGKSLIFIFSKMTLNIAITVTSAYVSYVLEKSKRTEYKLITQKEISLEKTSSILGFLLPAFVRKRVKEGIRYIAEDKGIVTVIFCDICDFDNICAEYTPLELTTFLDSVYKSFDQLCSSTGVSKIETVGKTYMACAGLQDFENDIGAELKGISHARRAIEYAISMILIAQGLKLKNGKNLQVKVGINSGPVTAGVVGFHKPQFSLVGDTVNTASRMCSTLERYNAIQISRKTYELLEDRTGLSFFETTVEARGKGVLTTYIVHESKDSIENINTHKSKAVLTSEIEDKMVSTIRKHSIFNNLDISFDFKRNTNHFVTYINFFAFNCKETDAQKSFRQIKMKNNYNIIYLSLLVAVLTYSILTLIGAFEAYIASLGDSFTFVARLLSVITLSFELLLIERCYLQRFYSLLMIIFLNILLYSSLVYIILKIDRWNDLIALEVLYVIILLNYSTGASVSLVAWASLLVIFPWVILVFFNSSFLLHAANTLFVMGFAFTNSSALYAREKQLRIYIDLQKLAEYEINRTNELLSQMMPPHVVENMRQGKGTTDKLYQVTLLYADIVGFTNWSSGKTPHEVVEMLGEMFTEFDKLCTQHNVYKVHTIGDCYVVMGYLDTNNRDPGQECINVLNMAFSMVDIINDINEKHNSQLNMRIGLHTGEVIAGIIGTNIVRYDIYGPDVLIANKMESGGEAGKINVSDVTRDILERRSYRSYVFSFNREIEARAIQRKHFSYFITY